MDRLLYVAMAGAKQAEYRQAIVAQNLANVTTSGFKEDLAAFRAVPVVGGSSQNARAYAVTQGTSSSFTAGPMQQTGSDLDVAVDGEGWISVQTATGEAYTRNGELAIDSTGLLKTRSGNVVIGEAGPLSVPENTRISVAPDGLVTGMSMGNSSQKVEIGRIKLVNPAADQLEKGSDGLFRQRNGQPALADEKVKLASGVLEGSNVNAVDQLVSMISTQRLYDMQVKMMQMAEQNDRSATQILSFSS